MSITFPLGYVGKISTNESELALADGPISFVERRQAVIDSPATSRGAMAADLVTKPPMYLIKSFAKLKLPLLPYCYAHLHNMQIFRPHAPVMALLIGGSGIMR